VKEVVKGLKLIKTQDWEAPWPQDLFSITALKLFYNNPPDQKYLEIRPNTSEDKLLFLSNTGGQMTVAAISAIIKRMD
ncbi:33503_t:CDS:2, partial [Racocetra persica]